MDVTLDEAVALIEEKVAKLQAKGRDPYPARKAKGGKKGKAAGSRSSSSGRGSGVGARPGSITGYALFIKEEKEAIRTAITTAVEQQGVKMKFMGAASQVWGGLGKEQQEEFSERARVISAQQQQQQVEGPGDSSTGQPSGSSSSGVIKAGSSRRSSRKAAAAAATKESSSKGKGSSSSKSKSSSSHVKGDGTASKRKMSGYSLFLKEFLSSGNKAGPGGSAFAAAADGWKALPQEQKDEYKSRAGALSV